MQSTYPSKYQLQVQSTVKKKKVDMQRSRIWYMIKKKKKKNTQANTIGDEPDVGISRQ